MTITHLASRAAGALLLALGCSACAGAPSPKPVNHYFADAREVEAVRRVMVLPFDTDAAPSADGRMVRSAFLQELAKVQAFEVVPLPDGAEHDERIYESWRHGRLSSEALVELGRRYQLDGVLMGTVTSYRPYLPPHMGLRVQLVSLHSGATVWAADAHYDASEALTIEDLRHYQGSAMATEATLHGHEINLISPRRFVAYVCYRMVSTWR
ncbi:MAG: hypothetical protein IT458_20910 [Planctomycetes bacterium]|nr:hypothetical protein [Planctomycetota bacterium]